MQNEETSSIRSRGCVRWSLSGQSGRRSGETVRLGTILLLLLGGTAGAVETPSIANGPSPSNVLSKVETPAAGKKSELDAMKDEFADLMKKRAGLEVQCRESVARINESRSTIDRTVGANTPTALKYRETVLNLEKALDAHPRILELQGLYDVAQTDKVAVSREQANILDAWQAARTKKDKDFGAEIEAAGKKAEAARHALLQQAGVKDVNKLSKDDQKRFWQIHSQYTNEMAGIQVANVKAGKKLVEMTDPAKDETAKQFEAFNARYKEIERNRRNSRPT